MGSCGGCRHFVVTAEEFEREVPGLKILSSAFGSVRADTGLCRQREIFCVPSHTCPAWLEVAAKEDAATVKDAKGRPVLSRSLED